MNLAKTPKLVDRFDYFNVVHRRLGFSGRIWTMDGTLEKAGGKCVNVYSLQCGLASQFRLKLWSDFNDKVH